jgi:hypothetical protein
MNSSSKILQVCPLHNAQYVSAFTLPSQTYYINYVVGTIFNTLFILTGIILNSVTILAYWRSARLRSKSSYFLIMLLSAFDLTTAIVGHLFFVLSMALTLNGNPNCTICISHNILTFSTVGMSLATLFVLNVERYLCIVHPFFHRTKITKMRLLSVAAMFWLYACLLTFSYPILGNNVARLITSSTTFLVVVFTVCIYISICCAVRRSASNTSEGNGNQVKKLQNLKMAKSCAIVVASTVMCFLPFAIIQFLEMSIFKIMFMHMWATTLTLLSASLNSLVFFWRNSVLREEAKAVLKSIRNSLYSRQLVNSNRMFTAGA